MVGTQAAAPGASATQDRVQGGAGLGDARAAVVQDREAVIVQGRRFTAAPLPEYGADPTPWEMERRHHDAMTGADISRFGNAYAIGSPLGSDERSNETGGQFVAPRHQ